MLQTETKTHTRTSILLITVRLHSGKVSSKLVIARMLLANFAPVVRRIRESVWRHFPPLFLLFTTPLGRRSCLAVRSSGSGGRACVVWAGGRGRAPLFISLPLHPPNSFPPRNRMAAEQSATVSRSQKQKYKSVIWIGAD